MGNKVHRLFSRALAASLLIAMLAFGLASVAQGPTVIEFWGGWTGPDAEVMRSIVERFNAEQSDIEVKLTMQQWSPLFDAFLVDASAGKSPDILAMHPQELAQFVVLGLILPVEDIIAGSNITPDLFSPNAWEINRVGDNIYAIPLDLHMHGLYYNVDAFEAAGIEAPPTNGEELLEIGRLLTVDANGNHPGDTGFDANNVVQYAINMHTNHHAFFQWWALYNQLGGQLFSEDNKLCAIDVDKATTAWQWLQDLVYVHGIAPQGQTDYAGDFKAGRTAMLIDGPWQMSDFINVEGLNWATAEYPQIFDEPATWGSGHNFTFPALADPAKRGAVLTFLEWMIEHSDLWAVSGQIPTAVSVFDSVSELPGREPFIKMLAYQKVFPKTDRYNAIFASNAPTPMMVMAQRIMLDRADIRTEVETACAEITSILSMP
ncbi:MAG: ABC transporter substrate-binding protein [Aggregatilineales bacterium]